MTESVALPNNSLDIVMNADLKKVQQQLLAITNFQHVVQNTLANGQDYGVIPGTNKPTLLKPGAEKIIMLMGLTSTYQIVEKVENYDEGFFAYTVESSLLKGDQLITQGFGTANTKETRYRLNEWEGEGRKKKVWKGDYQDPFTLANTVLKMAKKRAQVDAALTVGSLSNIFTQDIEDLPEMMPKNATSSEANLDENNPTITFGKYKGQSLKEVYEEDKGYVKWLATSAKSERLQEAASQLMEGYHKEKAERKDTNESNGAERITRAQIDEIETLAGIIGKANNLTVEEVIQAYGIQELSEVNQVMGETLIGRLNKKVSTAIEHSEEKQDELFDDRQLSDRGEETVSISAEDLPF